MQSPISNIDPKTFRLIAWVGSGAVCAALLLPALPALTGASPGTAQASSEPTEVVHLEIVARGAKAAVGQLAQPDGQPTLFVGCNGGRAVGGGYVLPPEAGVLGMTTSAPSDDGRNWNFRYPGIVPIGTKLYAVCQRS